MTDHKGFTRITGIILLMLVILPVFPVYADQIEILFPHTVNDGEVPEFYDDDLIFLVARYDDNSGAVALWYLDDERLAGIEQLNSFDNYIVADSGEHLLSLLVPDTDDTLRAEVRFRVIPRPGSVAGIVSPCLGFPRIIPLDQSPSELIIRLADEVDPVDVIAVELIPVDAAEEPMVIYQFETEGGNELKVPLDQASPGFYNLAVCTHDGKVFTQGHSVQLLDEYRCDYSFVHVTDPQLHEVPVQVRLFPDGATWYLSRPTPELTQSYFDVIDEISQLPDAQFAVITGDLVEYSAPENWRLAREGLLRARLPLFVIQGNHEYHHTLRGPDGTISLILSWYVTTAMSHYWNLINPALPAGAADTTRYGELLFVLFDSGHEINLIQPFAQYFFPDGSGPTKAQLDFMTALDPFTPKILLQHHPIIDHFDSRFCAGTACETFGLLICEHGTNSRCEHTLNPNYDSALGDSPLNLMYRYCFDYNVKLDLAGHTHNHRIFDSEGNELTFIESSSSRWPLFAQTLAAGRRSTFAGPGYRVINVVNSILTPYLETEGHIVYLYANPWPSAEHPTIDSRKLTLRQNRPNPFNPATEISYSLAVAADVEIRIVNILGQTVASHNLGKQPMGRHTFVFDGRDNSGRELPSGVYFYILQAGNERESRKMLLLK